ncbi:hypothetical protein GUJ93_ZPchr0002g23687 [Zizania palustris]|uniref:Uncharacterized protein n=1 Tax=Zizania palustris TaxID=103762 RepID=A0A8J5SBW6_ZIZPA|nr:hypothetical protein GUJ93_ZPchr0002g23687 [Zizania palustris]
MAIVPLVLALLVASAAAQQPPAQPPPAPNAPPAGATGPDDAPTGPSGPNHSSSCSHHATSVAADHPSARSHHAAPVAAVAASSGSRHPAAVAPGHAATRSHYPAPVAAHRSTSGHASSPGNTSAGHCAHSSPGHHPDGLPHRAAICLSDKPQDARPHRDDPLALSLAHVPAVDRRLRGNDERARRRRRHARGTGRREPRRLTLSLRLVSSLLFPPRFFHWCQIIAPDNEQRIARTTGSGDLLFRYRCMPTDEME